MLSSVVLILWALAFITAVVGTDSSQPASLVIAIPTVPRHRLLPDETPYLLASLRKWAQHIANKRDSQLNLDLSVVIVGHESFDDAFQQAREEHGSVFTFIQYSEVDSTNYGDSELCLSPLRDDDERRPLWKHVQKQALDLARTMRLVSRKFSSSTYFLLVEDDFVPCEGFIPRVAKMIKDANGRFRDWLSIRISYGFTGVLLTNGADVLRIADYVALHRARRPPDHLLVEFFAGETQEAREYKGSRQHLAYRWNSLEHIGEASTLRVRRSDSPKLDCWAALSPPILFEVETCSEFAEDDLCAPIVFSS